MATGERAQCPRLGDAVIQAAGIADHDDYGTHSLRKTFARKIYKNSGHDINLTRAVLGHREISTTQEYLDVDAGDVDATVLGLTSKVRPSKYCRRAAGR